MAEHPTAAELRAAEEQEQRNLERFVAHAARQPGLQARLRGVDPLRGG